MAVSQIINLCLRVFGTMLSTVGFWFDKPYRDQYLKGLAITMPPMMTGMLYTLSAIGRIVIRAIGPTSGQDDEATQIRKSLDALKEQNFSLLDSQRRLQDVLLTVAIQMSRTPPDTSGHQQSRADASARASEEENDQEEIIILPAAGGALATPDGAIAQADPVLREVAREVEAVAKVVNEQYDTLDRLGEIVAHHSHDMKTGFSETKAEFNEIREREKVSFVQQVWVAIIAGIVFLVAGWLLSDLVNPTMIIPFLH